MNKPLMWKTAGYLCTALGVWSFVWGVTRLGNPPLPNRHLLYDASYAKSLQVESIGIGLVLLLFGYFAFREGRR